MFFLRMYRSNYIEIISDVDSQLSELLYLVVVYSGREQTLVADNPV